MLGQLGRWRDRFSSLAIPDYRRYFLGQMLSQTGNTMQIVAQAWLVLQISNSGTALGTVTAIQYLPLLLLGPFGGLLADRFERRRVLIVTQSMLGLVAVALSAASAGGHAPLWLLYALAGCTGLVTAFDNPAKQSILSDLVPHEELNNAVTLNSISLNVARMLGPATGGVIIAFLGVSLCFAFNAVSFLGALWGLARMSPGRSQPRAERRAIGDGVLDGFRYAARTPQVLLPLIMVAVMGTFAWEFPVTLPLLAQRTFGGDARSYGLMLAVMGAGAVAGGLLTPTRSVGLPNLPLACLLWGVPILLTAFSPTLPVAIACLLLVGYGSISFNAMSKSTLQLGASPEMRGRVMALWGIAWQGSTPLGGPVVGWIGQHVGARWGLATGGIAGLVVGGSLLRRWRVVMTGQGPAAAQSGLTDDWIPNPGEAPPAALAESAAEKRVTDSEYEIVDCRPDRMPDSAF